MEPARLPFSAGWEWFRQGARLFFMQPMMVMLLHIIYFIVLVVLQLVPFIGMFAVYLLTPVMLAGILYAMQQIVEGREVEPANLFQVFNEKDRIQPMLTLGGLYMVSMLVITMIVIGVMFVTAGPLFPELLTASPNQLEAIISQHTETVFTMLLAMLGCGFIFGALVLMGFFYAIPLVMFNNTEPFLAIKSSLQASWRNMWPLFLFGMVHMLCVFLSIFTFFIALIIVMPITLAGWYVSFRDVYPEGNNSDTSPRGVLHV